MGYEIAIRSLQYRLNAPTQVGIRGLVLKDLQSLGVYERPVETRRNANGVPQLWDPISEYWMSTEFAISRFLTPYMARRGYALFVDCDILARHNVYDILNDVAAQPGKAIYVVKHQYDPDETIKMGGQVQGKYPRKNWSSVMLFDCDHEANRKLTIELINRVPGRDLHALCWLEDDLIGELSPSWNWLEGHSSPMIDASIVHYTRGTPDIKHDFTMPYADEWANYLNELSPL
jgi:hypothetical protein